MLLKVLNEFSKHGLESDLLTFFQRTSECLANSHCLLNVSV